MEFFASLAAPCDAGGLQRVLQISRLPQFCASIDKVLEDRGDSGVIYCLWGLFSVRRELINGGVRFSLPECPNALTWTVTAGLPPAPADLVIHCTINRQNHEEDFIASIEEFVSDWKTGLSAADAARQFPI